MHPGDVELIRSVVAAVVNRDISTLERMEHVGLSPWPEFWQGLDDYGLEFAPPSKDFLSDAEIIKFSDGRGYNVEIRLRSKSSPMDYVWLVLELLTNQEPHFVGIHLHHQ